MNLSIRCEDDGWQVLEDPQSLFSRAAAAALDAAEEDRQTDCEISLLLGDDDTLQDLNARFRSKDQPTNVLSFPAGAMAAPGPRFLGDIAMAFQTVAREAREQDKPLADHASHLMVHGVLHLLGYDHRDEREAEAMEALERLILAKIGIADPYDTAPGAAI